MLIARTAECSSPAPTPNDTLKRTPKRSSTLYTGSKHQAHTAATNHTDWNSTHTPATNPTPTDDETLTAHAKETREQSTNSEEHIQSTPTQKATDTSTPAPATTKTSPMATPAKPQNQTPHRTTCKSCRQHRCSPTCPLRILEKGPQFVLTPRLSKPRLGHTLQVELASLA